MRDAGQWTVDWLSHCGEESPPHVGGGYAEPPCPPASQWRAAARWPERLPAMVRLNRLAGRRASQMGRWGLSCCLFFW